MSETYRGRRISAVWNAKQLQFDLRITGKFVLWHAPREGIYSRKLAHDPQAKTVALDELRRWIDMADERGPDAFGPEWFVGAP
jgi:hypothetical protein